MNDDTTVVNLDARGIRVRGCYTIVLSSSLFYFRIPEGEWEDRMEKIARAGYNAIDTYFPWNFHERSPGSWDFSHGMRDVRRFLRLASRHGLYVIARPGPYICSEWDGGGLPAWLSAEGIRLRQNDPFFLSRTAEWFHRVLPLIAEHELGRGGSVILMQVENELDFFDCEDPAGYLGALRDMARAEGVSVPLIACAGQGDLHGAWGRVAGISPAVNMYFSPLQPGLEADASVYRDGLAELGHPVLITETGRDVLLLRRFLACGARLVGPYNQVAGFDFGFTASVNNWGTPLAFQTTHYDFDSLVGSFGEVRANAWEDHALGGLIRTLGPVLAAAAPCSDHGITLACAGGPAPAVLRLNQDGGEGFAAAMANPADTPLLAALHGPGGAVNQIRVAPLSSAFAFFNLSLSAWGLPGRIVFSSAEPFLAVTGRRTVLVFQAAVGGEVLYDLGDGPRSFAFDGKGIAEQRVEVPGGDAAGADGERQLVLYGIGRIDCARAAFTAEGVLTLETVRPARARKPVKIPWRAARLRPEDLFPSPAAPAAGRTLAMEANGAFRGYALYRVTLPEAWPHALGIVLHDAADVLSVDLDGRHMGTVVPGGSDAFLPLQGEARPQPHKTRNASKTAGQLSVRAEIWGHSNFDDPRLPAIRIGSLRGITGATLVMRADLIVLWRMDAGGGQDLPYLSAPGARLTGKRDPRYRSSCTVTPEASMDRFLLQVERPECPSLVRIDGQEMGWVDVWHPILDVTGAVRPGTACRVELEPRKWWAAESAGMVSFLQGTALTGWSFSRAEEAELADAAAASESGAEKTALPLALAAGETAWLFGALPDASGGPRGHRLTLRGSGIKASVFLGRRLVGRFFLESGVRPKMAGGRDDIAYLPACWRSGGEDQALRILVEAVERGRLVSVEIEPVEDP